MKQLVIGWTKLFLLLIALGFSACSPQLNESVLPDNNHSGGRLNAEKPVVLGYFPSWSETWPDANGNTKLTSLPAHVTHVFFSFAKPNLRYVKGSYDVSTAKTGMEGAHGSNGHMLQASVAKLKAKGTKVILSVGGEAYWGTSESYDINYQQIKDLVDDIGFDGVDWDFEPNGGFQTIGDQVNINRFIDFVNQTRAIMPRSAGYIIACAPAGIGALGGQTNNDPASKYAYAKRNTLTGDPDTYLYSFSDAQHSISMFGFSSTGHMIPVFQAVGSKIDLVAPQIYNMGAAPNRKLAYDAYAYYANTYGFKVAAGTHVPNEPWGPYYTYTAQKTAELSEYIRNGGGENRTGKGDGIMIWQLLAQSQFSGDANYTGITYLNVASKVLNGATPQAAIAAAFDYNTNPPPPTGPAAPTVSSTTGQVNTAITGQVASTGTLLILKDGTQISSQALSATSWSYTPTSAGSYTFKLQTSAGTSAASAAVTVTAGGGNGGGTGGCGYAAYNSAQAYPTAGTRVFFNNKIYENQWYANPGEAPNDAQQWGNWKFIQNCSGGGNPPTGPAAPTVSATTGQVNTAITGQVASTGTLLILKDGTQISSQALSATSWSYTPTSAGSYTFKLQTSAGTSAASAAVTVTAGGGNGGGIGGCGYAAYNSAQAYPTPGTRVFYNNKIYENQWYANPGEAPNDARQWGNWKFIQNCN